ncbi:MAG: helix-turn-helix transcriptional regulator [Leptospirales bacterium]|nr:helix-turn-helix transcriptional regulator [Leptospirales bacterium]
MICLLISLKRLSGQKDRLPRIFYLGVLAVILIPFFISLLDSNLLNSGLFSGVVSVLVLARSWQIVYRAESGKLASFLLLARADAYRKSGLSGERMKAVEEKIKLAIQSNEWMDPDYSLRDLSRQTGETVDVLSQVFSQHLGLSYPAYITALRLEAARRMLVDPAFAEFSVLRIGFEAGFNSKSAFHEAFKRATGGTPAEFRKKSKSM